jgi:hypothetical protein
MTKEPPNCLVEGPPDFGVVVPGVLHALALVTLVVASEVELGDWYGSGRCPPLAEFCRECRGVVNWLREPEGKVAAVGLVVLLVALLDGFAVPAALEGRLFGCEEFINPLFVCRGGYGCEAGCWGGGVSGAGEEEGGARPAKSVKAVTIVACFASMAREGRS